MSLETALAAAARAFLAELDAEPFPPKRGPGRPKSVESPSQPVAAQASPSVPIATPAPAASVAAISFKEVADELAPFANAGGEKRDQAVALLAKFGAAKASALKPEQYAGFLGELRALSAKPATDSLI